MDGITILGLVAALMTTSAFVPQVVKTWKTHQTKDISFMMYLILTLGIGLWIVYGIIRGDLPLVLANSISFCFAFTLLALKIKYK